MLEAAYLEVCKARALEAALAVLGVTGEDNHRSKGAMGNTEAELACSGHLVSRPKVQPERTPLLV